MQSMSGGLSRNLYIFFFATISPVLRIPAMQLWQNFTRCHKKNFFLGQVKCVSLRKWMIFVINTFCYVICCIIKFCTELGVNLCNIMFV